MKRSWLVPLVATTSCMINVPLAAPPPTDPPEMRLAAYNQLAPEDQHTTTTVSVNGNFASVNEQSSLVLKNGAIIYDPADLVPLVPADSVTAQAALASHSDHRKSRVAFYGGFTALVAGTVMYFIDGYQTLIEAPNGQTLRKAGITPVGYAGLGIGGVGALIGAVVGTLYTRRAQTEALAAFAAYDSGLRAQLRICSQGMQLVACP
jgi:hypothetical protein